MVTTEQVFGVSTARVLSTISRPKVDEKFQEALASDKQIIVYGSSKQGKTSLVSSFLPYEKHIIVRLSPHSIRIDIYSAILRSAGVELRETREISTEAATTATIGAKFKAMIPVFGSAETEAKGEIKGSRGAAVTYREIPVNLTLPNDVSELLKAVNAQNRFIILENFHYLDETRQKELAFDLRNFQELRTRFVVLGVWREKNRLAQFNGDLLDRSKEVPVEPWEEPEFREVAAKGAVELNVELSRDIVNAAIAASFSSIGVFQELIKQTCLLSGVTRRLDFVQPVTNMNCFKEAVRIKADEYSARHQRALEAIASGNIDAGMKGGRMPLFLPYYLVKIILQHGFSGLENGMLRSTLQTLIQAMHHRGADVRPSDMGNLLQGLAALQERKGISPPVIDYDHSVRKLQVVDSTFYFFLKNADLRQIEAELVNPLEQRLS